MKKKLFSIIMCVLMIMCYMPTAAFAEGTDADTTVDPVSVMNSAGTMVELKDNQYLATMDATTATNYEAEATYVAKYVGGKLYLNGYNLNATVSAESSAYAISGENYEIVVESDSKVKLTTAEAEKTDTSYKINFGGIFGYGVTISGDATLNLNIESKANGTNAFGMRIKDDLTATAPLNVTVKSSAGGWAKGILVFYNTITLSGADKVISATGANSDAGNGNAFGIQNYKYGSGENAGDVNIACNLKMETGDGIISVGIDTAGDVEINNAGVTISSSVMTKGIRTTAGDIEVKNSSVKIDLSDTSASGFLAGKEDADGVFEEVGTVAIEDSTVDMSTGSSAIRAKAVNIKNTVATLDVTDMIYAIDADSGEGNNINLSEGGCVTLKSPYQYLAYNVVLGTDTYVATGSTEKFGEVTGAVRVIGADVTEGEDTVKVAVIKSAKVAEVNGTKYNSLQGAVDAASAGQTVKLLDDVTLDTKLSLNKNVTLDLNGHKISNGEKLGTDYLIEVVYGAEASLVGNVAGSKIVDTRNNATGKITAICVLGSLNVSGDELAISRGDNGIAIKVDESDASKQGKLTVNSGTIKSTQAIQNWGISSINGGTFNGKISDYAYGNVAGNLTINDGTFNGEVFSAQLKYNDRWATVSAKTSIKGGTFNAGIAEYYDDGTNGVQPVERSDIQSGDKESIVEISGGTFSSNPTAYVADGYAAVGNTDGTWTVKATSDNIKVTKADDKTTVVETTTEGSTTTVTNADGSTSTTVKTNETTDSTGAKTSTETTLEVKTDEDNVKVETKTEATTVKTTNVETTEAKVTTKKGDVETVVTTKSVKDTENNTEVNTRVEGTKAAATATVETPTSAKETLVVDATAAKASTEAVKTVEVKLPAATVEVLKEAAKATEESKKVETVELKTDVATLEIDNTALKTLTGAAEEEQELVLKVEKKESTAVATDVVKGATGAFELTAQVAGKDVFKSDSESENGAITVKVPYEAPASNETVKVYYVADDSSKEDMNAEYKDGYLTWSTNHFSLFATATVEREIKLSGTNVTTQNAKTVTVDVNVDENESGIAMLQLDLAYNKSVLTLTKVENGEVFKDFLVPTEDEDAGDVNLDSLQFGSDTAKENTMKTGKLATLTFKVADNAEAGDYPITITCSEEYNSIDKDKNSVKVTVTNPTVTVVNVLYGDVNNDGKVDAKDVMKLRRHIAKWKSCLTLENSDAADVDLDGKTTLRDVAILGRSVAQWDDYKTLPYKG